MDSRGDGGGPREEKNPSCDHPPPSSFISRPRSAVIRPRDYYCASSNVRYGLHLQKLLFHSDRKHHPTPPPEPRFNNGPSSAACHCATRPPSTTVATAQHPPPNVPSRHLTHSRNQKAHLENPPQLRKHPGPSADRGVEGGNLMMGLYCGFFPLHSQSLARYQLVVLVDWRADEPGEIRMDVDC